jgi:hypothetical protein
LPIKHVTSAIQNAPQQSISNRHKIGAILRLHASASQQGRIARRQHHHSIIIKKADDFRIRPSAILARYAALATYGSRKGAGMDNLAIKATHAPGCI